MIHCPYIFSTSLFTHILDLTPYQLNFYIIIFLSMAIPFFLRFDLAPYQGQIFPIKSWLSGSSQIWSWLDPGSNIWSWKSNLILWSWLDSRIKFDPDLTPGSNLILTWSWESNLIWLWKFDPRVKFWS